MFPPFSNKSLLKTKDIKPVNNEIDLVNNLFVAAKESDIALRSITIKGTNINITRSAVSLMMHFYRFQI